MKKKKINEIGLVIKNARQKKNMSREKLSIMLALNGYNISAQIIYYIETGRRLLYIQELKALFKILDI